MRGIACDVTAPPFVWEWPRPYRDGVRRASSLRRAAEGPYDGSVIPHYPNTRAAFAGGLSLGMHVGTNGQVSSWGASLAGTAPPTLGA